MPKYPLVSELLNDLLVASGDDYEWGTLWRIIDDEWHNGNIKLLIQRQGEEAPTVVEPLLRRTLYPEMLPSGGRHIKCVIYYRRDSGHLVEEFMDPSISDEDRRYVEGKAADAGLSIVLAEADVERLRGAASQEALPEAGPPPEPATPITAATTGGPRKRKEAPIAAAMADWFDGLPEREQAKTPNALADVYRKDPQRRGGKRYAVTVFKNLKNSRGRI